MMQDMSSVRGSESGPDTDIRTKVFCKKRGLRLGFPAPAADAVLLLALFSLSSALTSYFIAY